MTLAQVQAVVAVVIYLGISWAGLMLAAALLFPAQTSRAEEALESKPKLAVVTGAAMLILALISQGMIRSSAPLLKIIGFLLFSGITVILVIGAGGISQLMGKRIAEMSGAKTSFGMLARGCAVYSIAGMFPYVGWFIFAPVSILCSLGAGVIALWPVHERLAAPPIPPFSGNREEAASS